jgi:signal transduction histidine kinase
MSPLMRSIRVRLALIFSGIVLGAIAGVYVYVAPRLETRLRGEKLATLARAASLYSRDLARDIGARVDEATVARAVRQAADRSGSRVTLFGVARGSQGLQTYPMADSTEQPRRLEDVAFTIATEAARSGRAATGTEPTTEGRIGEAALPLFSGGRVARVAVFSSPMGDVQRNVELIRRQIAIAGGIMLLFASVAGYLVAQALSRRIKRLETAAEKVAAGDFSQTIPTDGEDELADLARAFNDMQGQLAQLDSARKRFIATASHELRTPIFSLGGFVELLQDEEIDEETRAQFLEQIAEQLARLRRLTAELLDLSRLEAGSLELRPEPTDVGDLAREVTQEFTPALARHDSHLELRLARNPVRATCDRERVAQIMRILIDNALAHTPRGTDIFVSATRENGSVRLAVRDHGLGIHRTVLPRIFEPFFTSDDAQGSGLGLAIARELAERMEGRLDVESVPGRTVFTLELPS